MTANSNIHAQALVRIIRSIHDQNRHNETIDYKGTKLEINSHRNYDELNTWSLLELREFGYLIATSRAVTLCKKNVLKQLKMVIEFIEKDLFQNNKN